MGRRLEALEEQAGVVLLQKTPEGYVLTAAGEAVLAHVERIEQEALAIERTVTGSDVRLEGTVRFTSIEPLVVGVLTPVLAEFSARYPGITLELVTDTRTFSLARREADVALRLARPEGNELVARKVGEVELGLYASPAYLDRFGPPDFATRAAGHRLVVSLEDRLAGSERDWVARMLGQAHVVMRTNSHFATRAAAEAGVGIAGLLHLQTLGRNLVRLTPPEPPPRREPWLATHEDTRHTPRIRALMEALTAGLREHARMLVSDPTGA